MKLTVEKEYPVEKGKTYVFSASVFSETPQRVFIGIEGIDGECLNCSGKDYLGNSFTSTIECKANEEKRVWFSVKTENTLTATIFARLENGKILFNKDVLFRVKEKAENPFEKLAWLNSDYAVNDVIPAPFCAIEETEKGISFLGREILFNSFGLPAQIKSYFNKSGKVTKRAGGILARPIRFIVAGENFSSTFQIKVKQDRAELIAQGDSANFQIDTKAYFEFDGYARYEISLTAKKQVEIENVALEIPLAKRYRTYFMGLGKKGDVFDENLDWKWNPNHQDAFWCGDTDGGLRVAFSDEDYQKPLINIYYEHKPLKMPKSWWNEGKGGIKFTSNAFKAYTGRKLFKAGETAQFNFEMLITPFKEIDLKKQFSMRIFHTMFDSDTWFERAKDGGASIINVHHGNDLNPFINYPFVEEKELEEFTSKCHNAGIKTKIYYTMRELTVNMPEFTALRDFGYEFIQEKSLLAGGNFWQGEAREWIRKNVGDDVIPAWRQPLKGNKYKDKFDSAVVTDGQSRLCNFYIEGLKYLVEKADIDGIYVDDIAYDRNTMKRVRKTLDVKKDAYIDFHTWNHFNSRGGMINSAILYTELFPYVDKLWVGEGYDYNETPEYWLTEISGMPFGLMSEMMDVGNPYKGLTFGMTSRLAWSGENGVGDPRNIWELIDKLNLAEYELIGWWDSRNLIELDSNSLRASLYKKGKKVYVALANFSANRIQTNISWNRRAIKGCYLPEIEKLQKEKKVLGSQFCVEGHSGAFFEILF